VFKIPFKILRNISKIVKNLTLFHGWIRFEQITIYSLYFVVRVQNREIYIDHIKK